MSLLLLALSLAHAARTDRAVAEAWAEESGESKRRSDRDMALLLGEDPAELHLELLIAEASEAQVASRWGHALLRFVDEDGDPFNDLVLAFGAELDRPRVSLWRGVVGGYTAVTLVRRMGWIYLDYVQEQGRSLDRVPLPSDPEHVAALLAALGERDREGLGPYTFFKANCAGLLVDLLVDAGFPRPDAPARIPVHLDQTLAEVGVAPLPPAHVGLPNAVFVRAAALAGISEQALRSGDWPPGTAARLGELAEADRLRLLHAVSPPSAERAALLASLPPPSERAPLTEVLGFDELSPDLYALCTEVSCARRTREAAELRFGAAALDERLSLAPDTDSNPFERHIRLLREARDP